MATKRLLVSCLASLIFTHTYATGTQEPFQLHDSDERPGILRRFGVRDSEEMGVVLEAAQVGGIFYVSEGKKAESEVGTRFGYMADNADTYRYIFPTDVEPAHTTIQLHIHANIHTHTASNPFSSSLFSPKNNNNKRLEPPLPPKHNLPLNLPPPLRNRTIHDRDSVFVSGSGDA
jgi:hypothetical protein